MPIRVKKEVTSEENVITPREFEDLEKKEGKPIKLKTDDKEEEKPQEKRHEKATDIDLSWTAKKGIEFAIPKEAKEEET